jgi:hypothetical protein
MNVFEQIVFIGYTSVNPVLVLILLISILSVSGELYFQVLAIKPSLKKVLPQSLILGVVGGVQALMIPLVAQHTLPVHQSLVRSYIALFFAVTLQGDVSNLGQESTSNRASKILAKASIGLYIFITLNLFLRPIGIFGAIVPAIVWGAQFVPLLNSSKHEKQEDKVRQYFRGVYLSALMLSFWTFFTISSEVW